MKKLFFIVFIISVSSVANALDTNIETFFLKNPSEKANYKHCYYVSINYLDFSEREKYNNNIFVCELLKKDVLNYRQGMYGELVKGIDAIIAHNESVYNKKKDVMDHVRSLMGKNDVIYYYVYDDGEKIDYGIMVVSSEGDIMYKHIW